MPSVTLVEGWTICSCLSILIPIVVWGITRNEEGNNAEGNNEEGEGSSAIFIYIWSLLLFLCLTLYGMLVLRSTSTSSGSSWGGRWFGAAAAAAAVDNAPLRVAFLTGSIFAFGWFSFLLTVLTTMNGNGNGNNPEGASFGLLPMTFSLWTVFCGVFTVLLVQHNGSTVLAPDEADYREYTVT
jgi:hypothetical protein